MKSFKEINEAVDKRVTDTIKIFRGDITHSMSDADNTGEYHVFKIRDRISFYSDSMDKMKKIWGPKFSYASVKGKELTINVDK